MAKKPVKPKPKPKPSKPKPLHFIDQEINRQIAQDANLTTFQNQANKELYKTLSRENQIALANTPDGYNPAGFNTGGDLAGLYGNLGSAQQAMLKNDTVRSAQNMLGSVAAEPAIGKRQHKEFARRVRGLKPSLMIEWNRQKQAEELQKAQIDLARWQAQMSAANDAASLEADITNEQNKQISAAQEIIAKQQAELQDKTDKLRKELFFVKGGKWNAPRQQFRTSMERLQQLGYRPRDAAQIAAQWSRDSDRQLGKPVTFRPGRAAGFYLAMVNRGVNKKWALKITRQYYPGWKPKNIKDAAQAVQGGLGALPGGGSKPGTSYQQAGDDGSSVVITPFKNPNIW